MDVALITAFATPFMAMLGMLWHQQRSILKQLGEIGERLARIEGYLGIGMPPSAATGAAGAHLVSEPAREQQQPSGSGEHRTQAAASD